MGYVVNTTCLQTISARVEVELSIEQTSIFRVRYFDLSNRISRMLWSNETFNFYAFNGG